MIRATILILVLSAPSLCGGRDLQQSVTAEPGAEVWNFQSEGTTALQALLRLAQVTGTPIGIVQDDAALSTTSVNISTKNATLPEILDRILPQVRGYRWEYSQPNSVILILPISPRPITDRFLNLTIPRFSPPRMGIQGLGIWLWMFARAALNPSQGSVGNILENPDDPTFQIDERNATVEQLLNKIVLMSKGAWVLAPLPDDLTVLGSVPPFTLISNKGS